VLEAVCSNPVERFRKGLVEPENGAKRIRTADLLGAIQALSQLSYSPAKSKYTDPFLRLQVATVAMREGVKRTTETVNEPYS
jgi:hypothetical protein